MITLRQATIGDAHDVDSLQRMVYPPDLHESERVLESILALSLSWVAELHDKRLVGYMLVHPINDIGSPPLLDVPLCKQGLHQHTFIHDTCVHPAYRGRSIATSLLQCLASYNKDIYLVSLPEALGFWQRHGFIEVPVQPSLPTYPIGSLYMYRPSTPP